MTSSSEKMTILLEMLEQQLTMLHIDARRPEVRVPDHLLGNPNLCINLSYRFRLPDLHIDEEGVSATLSFQQIPFHCYIPFDAIWALSFPSTSEQRLFIDSAPKEYLLSLLFERTLSEDEAAEETDTTAPSPQLAVAPQLAAEPIDSQPVQKSKPALRLVTSEVDAPPPTDETPQKPAPKRPTLRLIKNEES